ncbi:Flagella basal body P-ring formation protein FlgA (plasmid) [Rhodovastum atsumiense]|uniref:flagellar basal body P-ring formation chaperone FlgA n=1 Tax=Rhodovastum atsumiense TaxID=504468 RepID=UPI00202552DD|nr:flagellar basal body P-ring formation chaperone FlgA [Rhodovastum atsumiense]CAH2605448.1 Flagella basal body P-ring formation protein FlgA [Rhodovastum atsumiense]
MRKVVALLVLATALLPAAKVRADEIWHAARALQRGEVVQEGDLTARLPARAMRNGLPGSVAVVGLEMRRRVAAGTPLTDRDIGPRLAVQANAVVRMVWQGPGMRLEMTGRALEAGSTGETIRVLNTATSRTVQGTVREDGSVMAGGSMP